MLYSVILAKCLINFSFTLHLSNVAIKGPKFLYAATLTHLLESSKN